MHHVPPHEDGQDALHEKESNGRVCGARAQVYYGDILPPVGSQQISYARFMDLVHRKRVKRIVLMSDGKVAMVEVPVEGYASKLDEARFDRKDEECAALQIPEPLAM